MIILNNERLQAQLSGFPRLQTKNSFLLDDKEFQRHFHDAHHQHPGETDEQCRERAVIRCLTLDKVQTEDTVLAPIPEFRAYVERKFNHMVILQSIGFALLGLLELYRLLK